MAIKLRIEGKDVYFSSNLKKEIRVLKDSLKFQHPERFNIPSYQSKDWDGYVRYYDSQKNKFKYAFLSIVKTILKKKQIQFTIEGEVFKNTDWIDFSTPFLPKKRFYQREAILNFFKMRFGVIKVPTRGGKTFIAAECMRLARKIDKNIKILFLTESSDIMKQNPAEIANFLNLNPKEVGLIQGEKFDIDKNVVFAMVQTLVSKMKKTKGELPGKTRKRKWLLEYIKSVDFLVIDEIHEFLSDSRINIIKKFNPRLSMSMSATPKKKNKFFQYMKLRGVIGDVIYDIPENILVKNKVLAESRTCFITAEYKSIEGDSYQELLKNAIYNNPIRNKIILDIINVCEKLNKKLLVMFWSVEHMKNIHSKTGIEYLHGEHSDKHRAEVKARFLKQEKGILLVTEIWKKGVTLPNVEVFLNAAGGKEDTNLIQKRGRVLGVTDTKSKALVFDIVDFFSKHFAEHSLKRIEAYEEQVGKQSIDIIGNSKDLETKLEIYIKNWFDGK